ncbi:BrnA antitoxin family protein [Acidisoma sp. 7E03]
MTREEESVRYSAAELRAMRERGASKTDVARVSAKTEDELERDIAFDPDWAEIPRDWRKNAEQIMPGQTQLLSLRLDHDVVQWFRDQGPGYQTRINAVLRAFVQEQTQRRA